MCFDCCNKPWSPHGRTAVHPSTVDLDDIGPPRQMVDRTGAPLEADLRVSRASEQFRAHPSPPAMSPNKEGVLAQARVAGGEFLQSPSAQSAAPAPSKLKASASLSSVLGEEQTIRKQFNTPYTNCLAALEQLKDVHTPLHLQTELFESLAEYHSIMLQLITTYLKPNELAHGEMTMPRAGEGESRDVYVPGNHLSHEIRAPIQAANLEIESFQHGEQSIHSLTAALDRQYKHLEELIAMLPNTVGASMQKITADYKEFTFPKLEAKVHSMTRLLARDAGMKVQFHFPSFGTEEGYEKVFSADFSKISQVLINFTRNAISYGKKEGELTGKVDIYIDVDPGPSPSTCILRFRVRDYGQGISAEDQLKLFKPHSKAKSPGSPKIESSGIGLSLCLPFVTVMNPDVHTYPRQTLGVDSQLGVGSTFWFTSLANTASELKPPLAASPAPSLKLGFSKPDVAILWADDVGSIRTKMGAMLLRGGCGKERPQNRALAESAEDAIAQCRIRSYDVVFLDQNMGLGKMKGTDAARIIRKEALALNRKPPAIVIVTGDEVEEIQQELGELASEISVMTKGEILYAQLINTVNLLTKE